jgi:hypothetical protein
VKIEVASLLADHFDNKDEGCFIQVFRRWKNAALVRQALRAVVNLCLY